jgi:hypothetical protein
LAATLVLGIQAVAQADPVPGLFPTGVDVDGVLLTGGKTDPHYVLVSSADPSFPGPAAVAASVIPGGYWLANDSMSRWIAPNDDENYPAMGTAHPGGAYVYRLSFDLTGLDPATVSISGTWGVDNQGTLELNGVPTGIGAGSYNPLVPFAIGSGFVSGLNRLDFVVTNIPAGGSNPTGLRVGSISGSGQPVAVGVNDTREGSAFELAPPFPNPARGAARFAVALSRGGPVRLVVRDATGRTVRTLIDGEREAGRFQSLWDGRAADGSPTAAGVYFLDLTAEGRRASQRIVRVP